MGRALIAAAVLGLAGEALGADEVRLVGTIDVGYPLGKLAADPSRPKVYGITATGEVVFIDRTTMSVEHVASTGRVLRDIDVHPDGDHLTVLDNVTGEYWNQPPAVYLLSFDLGTQSQSGIVLADAPLYQIAHAAGGRVAGIQTNQWVSAYLVDGQSGARLSSTGAGYYGGTDWEDPNLFTTSADGTRLYRTDIGISSIDVKVFDTSTSTITLIDQRTVGSYANEPVFVNSTTTSLYVGDIRVEPHNIHHTLAVFPENILAGTGDDRLCFGTTRVFDPVWGNSVQTMPVAYDMVALGEGERYLYAFSKASQELHVLAIGCRADVNGDGEVNTQDVLAFLNLWASGEPEADFNGDGTINTQDVLAFLNAWTAGC